MTRDELLQTLLLERYGPRPRRCDRRQEPAPEPVSYFTDTPAAQARRRMALSSAIDSKDEFADRNIA